MNKSLVFVGGVIVVALSTAALMGLSSNSDPVRVVAGSPVVEAAPIKAAPTKALAPKKQEAVGVSHEGESTYYTVQPFDIGRREGTLTFIAQRFHTSVDQLVRWNHIKDRDVLDVHQRLRVQ